MSGHADTISTLVDTVQRWKASHDALVAENQRLRDALERSDRALRLLLARKPVRDVAETLAETSAALDGTPSKATT